MRRGACLDSGVGSTWSPLRLATMNLRPLLDKLHRSRDKFEKAARRVPEKNWRTPPREGAWWAAEVVAHVIMVETLMTGAAAKITKKPPLPVPLWLLDDREAMLSHLIQQRQRTLSVLQSGGDSDFRRYRLQHPLLGSLRYYDWFRTLAAHDERHTKQLHEIIKVRKIS